MSSKKIDLFYVLKINVSQIIHDNYLIDCSFQKAKESNSVIALGDNQLLKFIRSIKKCKFDKESIEELYKERNYIKTQEASKANSKKIQLIQTKIDEKLFVPDLISVKVDTSKKDYKIVCKNGFVVKTKINNTAYECTYKRLCAGAGQLRRNTVLFVNSEIYDELETIMMCGLTKNRVGKINLAKFSAYFSLYTSAMKQVKKPNICVIPDLEFELPLQTVKWIFDGNNGEKDIEDREISFMQNAFDGSGIISPQMASIWQEDLGLDYLPSSFILRSAWIKGLVTVFDFKKFAEEIAHTDKIKDIWGKEYDIKKIDVILTASQFKMYKKYQNFDEYNYYHSRYNHIYGVTRVNKKESNIYTPMNYQYIQSNDFTEDSIKDLAQTSVEWINQIMTCDLLPTYLFLLGCQNSSEEQDINQIESNANTYIAKSILYNKSLLNDEYIRRKITKMIDKKVQQSKVGKLLVKGSYEFLIPDLYALCEHAFGMEVHGILKENETWSDTWVKNGSSIISMQRSPLVAPSENQIRHISFTDECKEWFKYIVSGNIMSIWDLGMIAMSDM